MKQVDQKTGSWFKPPIHDWVDKDIIMLYGMMDLLVDFVENEKCFEVIDWENDEANPAYKEVAKEIREIYDWWKSYKEKHEMGSSINDDVLYQEEQKMLHRLIDVRKHLWT